MGRFPSLSSCEELCYSLVHVWRLIWSPCSALSSGTDTCMECKTQHDFILSSSRLYIHTLFFTPEVSKTQIKQNLSVLNKCLLISVVLLYLSKGYPIFWFLKSLVGLFFFFLIWNSLYLYLLKILILITFLFGSIVLSWTDFPVIKNKQTITTITVSKTAHNRYIS